MSHCLAQVRGFPRAGARPLDLDVQRGDVLVIRGSNGSGKTSLLRGLAGLATPLPATFRLLGNDPAATPASTLANRVALSPQEPRDGLVGLTVEGELRMRRRRLPPALEALAGRDVAHLSSGEARRTVLCLADGEASLLLLDEAAEGLDKQGRNALVELIQRHRKRGAVVAVDHQGLLESHATRTIDLSPERRPIATPLPPAPDGPTLLACPAGRRNHLEFPSIELGPGVHALVGPNGSGKTTLLRRLAGLERLPAQQAPRVRDQPAKPGQNIGLLPARARDLLGRDTVRDELVSALDRAAPWVDPKLLHRHPLSLSGGEAQRVALAKLTAQPHEVFLLDEPEAHLDADGRAALTQWLAQATNRARCVVLATHDHALIQAAHRVIHLGAEP